MIAVAPLSPPHTCGPDISSKLRPIRPPPARSRGGRPRSRAFTGCAAMLLSSAPTRERPYHGSPPLRPISLAPPARRNDIASVEPARTASSIAVVRLYELVFDLPARALPNSHCGSAAVQRRADFALRRPISFLVPGWTMARRDPGKSPSRRLPTPKHGSENSASGPNQTVVRRSPNHSEGPLPPAPAPGDEARRRPHAKTPAEPIAGARSRKQPSPVGQKAATTPTAELEPPGRPLLPGARRMWSLELDSGGKVQAFFRFRGELALP